MLTSEKTVNGANKVDQYSWSVIDKQGVFMSIDKNLLHVDHDYQRDGNNTKALNLARNWSWVACGAISVSKRSNGAYFVMEGQHRVLAAQKRSDIKELPCMVFSVESTEDEAKGFLNANGNRKAVSALAKFKAAVYAKDEVAIFVNNTIKNCGLHIANETKYPGQIKSIKLCMEMASSNQEQFKNALEIAAYVSGESCMPVYERLLAAIWYMQTNVVGGVSQRLIDRMTVIGAKKLLRAAADASSELARGGANTWARGMLFVVNQGLRKNRFEFILR